MWLIPLACLPSCRLPASYRRKIEEHKCSLDSHSLQSLPFDSQSAFIAVIVWRPHLNLECLIAVKSLHSFGLFLPFSPDRIHIFHNSFVLMPRSVQAVSSEEVKLLEAMKYGGSLLHWTDCSDVDKRRKISHSYHIFLDAKRLWTWKPVSRVHCMSVWVFFF